MEERKSYQYQASRSEEYPNYNQLVKLIRMTTAAVAVVDCHIQIELTFR